MPASYCSRSWGSAGRAEMNPYVFPSPGVDHDQQAARRAQPERDEALLIRIGFVVDDRDRVWVVKDLDGFRDADTVLAKIRSGFALLVPLEPHNLSYARSVHTSTR